MGEAEINTGNHTITIHSHLITYGTAADPEVTERIRAEIEIMWNAPLAHLFIENIHYTILFRISAEYLPSLSEMDVIRNTNPRNNYFRIDPFVHGDISFVDGLGCNTGYFKLDNLYAGSTTAAHEFGHTLGLDHPHDLDIRGRGVPGIMYPRGTLVDPEYQYDPAKRAGETGGTMHPMHRKVKQQDIEQLKLHRFPFSNSRAIVGEFTNIYHWQHKIS